MAKKDAEVTQNKPVEVRQQTAEEIRRRLKSQGKLKDTPKKEKGGVNQLTEEDALVKIAERGERVERESKEENKLVRPLNKKDVALSLAARKAREADGDGTKKPDRVLTKEDIETRDKAIKEAEELGDKCPKCGQVDDGQELHGEYLCPDCGLPTVHDLSEPQDTGSAEPVEIFAKDVVSFKDDDGKIVTGKVKRVTAKNEAIIDVEDGDDEYTYTVPCDLLTKEKKEEK